MMRIKSISYCYFGPAFAIGRPTNALVSERGMVEFTVVGDDTKYYMKVDADSRHEILNVKSWDYSELEELHINYVVHGKDTPVEIDVEHIIKLPIKHLSLAGVTIKGQPRGAKIVGDKDCPKYVWDNVLMYLPTLQYLTLEDDGILYSLDFTYNPDLKEVTLVCMDIRDIKGYDTQDNLGIRLIRCSLNEDTAVALMKHSLSKMRQNKDDFTLELSTEL